MQDVADEMHEDNFMRSYIFHGLRQLSLEFDSEKIPHFRAQEFLQIIERCERFGIPIFGVEIFTDRAELLAIEIAKTDSPFGFVPLVARFCGREDVSICASFGRSTR